MSEKFDLENMPNKHDSSKELLDIKKVIKELETQQTKAQLASQKSISMSSQKMDIENLKDPAIIAEPDRSEVIVITTKIHSFDKPVFVTMPKSKVYTILGKIPTLRIPQISTENIEIHIMNDEEIAYSIHSEDYDEEDFYFGGDDIESMPEGIFIICGKNFGTRKLDALASILLKLNLKRIIVQKYSYSKNNKSTQWVPEHNKQVTKLEHHIYKILRNNE